MIPIALLPTATSKSSATTPVLPTATTDSLLSQQGSSSEGQGMFSTLLSAAMSSDETPQQTATVTPELSEGDAETLAATPPLTQSDVQQASATTSEEMMVPVQTPSEPPALSHVEPLIWASITSGTSIVPSNVVAQSQQGAQSDHGSGVISASELDENIQTSLPGLTASADSSQVSVSETNDAMGHAIRPIFQGISGQVMGENSQPSEYPGTNVLDSDGQMIDVDTLDDQSVSYPRAIPQQATTVPTPPDSSPVQATANGVQVVSPQVAADVTAQAVKTSLAVPVISEASVGASSNAPVVGTQNVASITPAESAQGSAPSSQAIRALTIQQLTAPLASSVAQAVARPDGSHTTVVKISPEALGPVAIEATSKDGHIRLEISAATEAGRENLKHILVELRREMASTGAIIDMSSGKEFSEKGSSEREFARPQQPEERQNQRRSTQPQNGDRTDNHKSHHDNGGEGLDIYA